VTPSPTTVDPSGFLSVGKRVVETWNSQGARPDAVASLMTSRRGVDVLLQQEAGAPSHVHGGAEELAGGVEVRTHRVPGDGISAAPHHYHSASISTGSKDLRTSSRVPFQALDSVSASSRPSELRPALATRMGDFQALNVHLPSGREASAKGVVGSLLERSGTGYLMGGDMNLSPAALDMALVGNRVGATRHSSGKITHKGSTTDRELDHFVDVGAGRVTSVTRTAQRGSDHFGVRAHIEVPKRPGST
jgi:endonuclease/exonuclease/phosphatase family metal-dependent hydrolase